MNRCDEISRGRVLRRLSVSKRSDLGIVHQGLAASKRRWTVSGVTGFGTSAMSHDERSTQTVVAPAPLSMT
jgi:hypothetical protein